MAFNRANCSTVRSRVNTTLNMAGKCALIHPNCSPQNRAHQITHAQYLLQKTTTHASHVLNSPFFFALRPQKRLSRRIPHEPFSEPIASISRSEGDAFRSKRKASRQKQPDLSSFPLLLRPPITSHDGHAQCNFKASQRANFVPNTARII